ncbi:ankyrin repeat domain-containing protein [Lysobacter sp. BMK333-48F3]|uniref:ankyrin repeat domain-containing protein n=1 Tax=Lysobacter sp. BMK333-48F3 TaxID=2867962 RepID=UPI001C8C5C4C|nr:ankyrin repeat domain-containing protein [Lysobacter sp. BMK333-48F3]MBX9402264.1 ankyrin repeat domain-containing protein [Lysobacter sp. BMK333-48F3]
MTVVVDVREIFADPAVADLAEAVAEGDAAEIRRRAAGVDLRVRGDKNVTLLEWAVLNKSPVGLRSLLDLGADPAQPGIDGSTVVHMAAMANDPSYLEVLLEYGADPDTAHAETGMTPLSSALMGGRSVQFKRLLIAGAAVDRADRMGNTALHVAAKTNQPGAALELLQAGADPSPRNAQSVTFQRYLFMTPPSVLSASARRDRDALVAWMRDRGHALENG